MTTMYNISCVKVIATLVFVLVTASNHCAAENPPAVAAEQNLFRQDRGEGVTEKPDSEKMGKKPDTSHLELYGTVILGDKKSALIYTHEQKTDKSQNQKRNKKAGVYSLGDSIGGYVISVIEEKRVVLDYQGEKVTLTLRKGKGPATGDVTTLEEEEPEPTKSSQRKVGVQEEKRKKSGSEPAAPMKSLIMSPEEAEEIVEFSEEILEDIRKSKGEVDRAAIDEKKEELKKRLMEKLEGKQDTGKEVR